MFKRIQAAVLVFVLMLSLGLPVHAATGGAGNGTVPGDTRTQGMTGNQGTIAAATDNDTDWGWIGLLGLIGLAGLMGRSRSENTNRG